MWDNLLVLPSVLDFDEIGVVVVIDSREELDGSVESEDALFLLLLVDPLVLYESREWLGSSVKSRYALFLILLLDLLNDTLLKLPRLVLLRLVLCLGFGGRTSEYLELIGVLEGILGGAL